MRKSLIGVDIEYRNGVSAFLHAPLTENNGNEVHTGGLEERNGCSGGQQAYVGGGDIANNVLAVVDYCDASEAFRGHED